MGRAEDLFERLKEKKLEYIVELINDYQSEELFLEFKTAKNDGNTNKLDENDRANLAKTISGFGNSGGGIVIWGIYCKEKKAIGDLPEKKPLENPERFRSWLEGAVSGCTIPAHPNVQHIILKENDKLGYVVTYISESNLAPHQTIYPAKSNKYYMRAGSSFENVPHAVLAGMFGKKPQPKITLILFHTNIVKEKSKLKFDLIFHLMNHGKSIAEYIYFNAIISPPSGMSISYDLLEKEHWYFSETLGCSSCFQAICKDHYKLPPGASIPFVILNFELEPTVNDELLFCICFGCQGSVINKMDKSINRDIINSSYIYFTDRDDSETDFLNKLLDLSKSEKMLLNIIKLPIEPVT